MCIYPHGSRVFLIVCALILLSLAATHYRPSWYVTGLKSITKIHKCTFPFFQAILRMFCMQERAWILCIFVKNHNTQTETDTYIYKTLTLHGKQLLLKCDQLQSHKSAVYFQRYYIMLKAKILCLSYILSHSWKGFWMASTIKKPTDKYVSES